MRHVKLTLAYDGTDFSGWQVQVDRRTVQGMLEATLEKIIGGPVRVTASGRTDAGVHALGQVAVFSTQSELDTNRLVRALNAELPDDIAVFAACEVPPDFDPIRHAVRKRYRYVIHDGPVRDVFRRRHSWHFTAGRLDVSAMQRAAAPLLGTHDFASFQGTGSQRATTVRTVDVLSLGRGTGHPSQRIVLEIQADGFLYNMVRVIVGTLVAVGRGIQDESWPATVLAAKDRRAAGPTAPPQGLFLVSVDYDDIAES